MHWMLMLFLTLCCSVFAAEMPPQEMSVDAATQTTTKPQEDVDSDDSDYDDNDVDDEATEEIDSEDL